MKLWWLKLKVEKNSLDVINQGLFPNKEEKNKKHGGLLIPINLANISFCVPNMPHSSRNYIFKVLNPMTWDEFCFEGTTQC